MKCILEFNTWKVFIFLSKLSVSLTSKTILIINNKLCKYHELNVYTEKFSLILKFNKSSYVDPSG